MNRIHIILNIKTSHDFSVRVITDKSSVKVSSQAFYHRDNQVVVNLENDTFIPERKNGITKAAFVSTLFGIVLLIVGFLNSNQKISFKYLKNPSSPSVMSSYVLPKSPVHHGSAISLGCFEKSSNL